MESFCPIPRTHKTSQAGAAASPGRGLDRHGPARAAGHRPGARARRLRLYRPRRATYLLPQNPLTPTPADCRRRPLQTPTATPATPSATACWLSTTTFWYGDRAGPLVEKSRILLLEIAPGLFFYEIHAQPRRLQNIDETIDDDFLGQTGDDIVPPLSRGPGAFEGD